MKRTGVLHHRLAEVIAQMGHGDLLVVADAGLPIPPGVERIDVAIVPGIPGVIAVTQAIAGELQVERITLATELIERNADLVAAFEACFPGIGRDSLTHEGLKSLTRQARAVVRTGECTPYANVTLRSGVTF